MSNQNKESKFKIRVYVLPIIIIGLLTALDQLTKFIITSSFTLYESRPVIKNVFSLTYIRNTGTAWGLFQGQRVIFLIIAAIILVLSFYIMGNIVGQKRYIWAEISIILLVSGAIGNMIDRYNLGYVIDFLHFELIDFPVFNLADIFVVCSMILLIILIMFVYKDEDIDYILGKDKNISTETDDETINQENDNDENE